MAVDEAKAIVHQLTNNAQMIIGYLEMNEAEKALAAAKESIRLLKNLTRLIGTAYKVGKKKE